MVLFGEVGRRVGALLLQICGDVVVSGLLSLLLVSKYANWGDWVESTL